MRDQVTKQLTAIYYAMMGLTICAALLAYLMVTNDNAYIDPYTTLGQVIQYIIIFDALLTIPGGLYLMKYMRPRLCAMAPDPLTATDEELSRQAQAYLQVATMRILLVGNSMVLGVAAFYIMGAYQSMIWVAGISAIAWIFTKPTRAKMDIELTPVDPNAETY